MAALDKCNGILLSDISKKRVEPFVMACFLAARNVLVAIILEVPYSKEWSIRNCVLSI